MKNQYIVLFLCALALTGCSQKISEANVFSDSNKNNHGKNKEYSVQQETESMRTTIEEVATELETEAATEMITEPVSETVTEPVSETVTEIMTETAAGSQELGGPLAEIYDAQIASLEAAGQKWSVSLEDLQTGEVFSIKEEQRMQSASVIKVFIMGAVYDRICYPDGSHAMITGTENVDLRSLLQDMITVSSNEAANTLLSVLGEGDVRSGMQVVNDFCLEHCYTGTSVGRRFLESNPTGDNYTSAADCRKILSDIYHGTLVNAEASGKMLEFLKGQQTRYKIPAGLPEGFSSANKTGEMPEGYGLGCIENDMAIVFSPCGDYVLVVLSNDLGGTNSQADGTISGISGQIAGYFLSVRGEYSHNN